MQQFQLPLDSTKIKDSLPLLVNSINSVLSCNSGAEFPTASLQTGMLCLRTDFGAKGALYQLRTQTPEATWDMIFDFNKAATDKEYVDTKLSLAGGQMTGSITFESEDAASAWARGIAYKTAGVTVGAVGGYGPAGSLTNVYMGTGPNPWSSSASYASIRANANNLTLESATASISGKFSPSSGAKRSAGMYGVYSAANIGHVWSMGTQYAIPDDGADFGTLYGIAYKHTTNPTGGTMAGGHQIVYCFNGTPNVAVGLAGGIWNNGNYVGVGSVSASNFLTSGSIAHEAAAAISVGSKWSYNGTTVWASGREADRESFRWWYYTDAGVYQNCFTMTRSGDFTAPGNVTGYSDARLKKNVQPITGALAKVDQLDGVTYDRIDMDVPRQTGLMAQDVLKVLPEAVVTDPDTGIMSLAYGNLAGLLVEAIKELSAKVDAQAKVIEALTKEG